MAKNPTPEIRMTVDEVAKVLGNTATVIHRWLIDGCPFGAAIPNGNGYTYIIIRNRFELYMAGTDLGGRLTSQDML